MPCQRPESARIRGRIALASESAFSPRIRPISMIPRIATAKSVRSTSEALTYAPKRNATSPVTRMVTRSATGTLTATAADAATIIRNSSLRDLCRGKENCRTKKCLPIQLLIRLVLVFAICVRNDESKLYKVRCKYFGFNFIEDTKNHLKYI